MADSDTEFDYNVPVRKSEGPRLGRQIGRPYVGAIADLDKIVKDPFIAAGEEFGFALEFRPSLIDAVCEHGFFPMALNLGLPVFAIKVHRERCVLLLQVSCCGCAHPWPPVTPVAWLALVVLESTSRLCEISIAK